MPCDIAIIGEAPGAAEVRTGRPFVGPSGDIFWQLASKYLWLNRSACYVDNLSQRRLDDEADTKLDVAEFTFWQSSLNQRLDAVAPKMVLAVGAFAARALLGDGFALHVGHGLPHMREGVAIVPVYHPAAALRGDSNSLSLTAYDLAQCGDWWRGKLSLEPDKSPSTTTVRPWVLYDFGSADTLAIDTEWLGTSDTPLCLTATTREGRAFLIWAHEADKLAEFGEYLRAVKPLVVFHHAQADLKPLRIMGIDIEGWGLPWRDTIEMAYLLRHEPQGLKDLAQRHLSLEMEDWETLVGRYYDPKIKAEAEAYVAANTIGPTPIVTHSPKTGKPYKKPRGGKITRDKKTKAIATALRKKEIAKLTALLGWPNPSLADVPQDEIAAYAAKDPDATLRLYTRFAPRLAAQDLLDVESLDNAVLPMFMRMSEVGLPFDKERHGELREYVDAELARLLEDCRSLADSGVDFNPGSSDQVALWCREQYKRSGICQLRRLTKGRDREAADKRALSAILGQHPLIAAILEYRSLAKLKSSYVDKLPSTIGPDGRYHPDWRLKGHQRDNGEWTRGIETGRAGEWILTFPSRTELGRRVRSCFVAPPGYQFASWDLSQIEYRITAALSQDQAMLSAYRSGKDLHHVTVERIFGGNKAQRPAAKVVNFRMLYGGGAKALYDGLIQEGIVGPNRDPIYAMAQCDGIIADWWGAYPGVTALRERVVAHMRATGYSRTELGRRRYLPAIYLEGDRLDGLREEAIRQGFNHVIQGTAQEVIKRAMLRVWQSLHSLAHLFDVEPVLQYHDELVFLIPEGTFDRVRIPIEEAMRGDSERYGIPIETSGSAAADWGGLKE